jgi:hypothetical protein
MAIFANFSCEHNKFQRLSSSAVGSHSPLITT